MIDLKTVKEQAIDHLSVTKGDELDLTCNISTNQQIQIIMESEAHSMLGSTYYEKTTTRLLRLTNSFGARHRQDIVDIAKASGFDKEGVS